MPKGKFTAADLDQQAAPAQTGQFTAADLDQSQTSAEPGILDKEIPLTSHGAATLSGLQSVGRGVRGALSGMYHLFDPASTPEEQEIVKHGGGLSLAASRAVHGVTDPLSQAGEVPGAVHDINQSVDPVGTYAKAAQETAGQGAGQALTAAATEGVGKAVGAAADAVGPYVKPVGKGLVRGYISKLIPEEARTAYRTVKNTPVPDMKATFPDEPLGPSTPDPALLKSGGLAKSVQVSEPANALDRIPVRSAPEPTFPSSPEGPATPDPALLKAGALAKSFKSADPSAGLGKIPQRGSVSKMMGAELADLPATEAQPAAQTGEALGQRGSIAKMMQPEAAPPIARPSLHEMLDTVRSQIQEGLGGEDLNPKAPIRQQPKPADLPEGHRPVTSSAVKSYKYDAGAKEFHTQATSGNTVYVYGDVTPEEAQAFEGAESKGKAFQAIKGHPLVAKIINGKRVAVTPALAKGT